MDTVVLVSVFVLLPLAVVVLLWVFRPAIISRHHASLPKKMNTFSDGKGVIEADNQIHDFAKCDISLVVPAYNEVRSYTSVSLLLKFTAYIACLPLLACWLRLVPMLDETTNFMTSWSARSSLTYEV
jgi:hypothetical protein